MPSAQCVLDPILNALQILTVNPNWAGVVHTCNTSTHEDHDF
jgi:hypothetical protein